MKRALSVRIVIAVLLVVLGLGMFVALTPMTKAALGLCTYYSNAKKTHVVGQRGTDCCGNPVSWGIVTAYKQCGVEYCIWCPPPTE